MALRSAVEDSSMLVAAVEAASEPRGSEVFGVVSCAHDTRLGAIFFRDEGGDEVFKRRYAVLDAFAEGLGVLVVDRLNGAIRTALVGLADLDRPVMDRGDEVNVGSVVSVLFLLTLGQFRSIIHLESIKSI